MVCTEPTAPLFRAGGTAFQLPLSGLLEATLSSALHAFVKRSGTFEPGERHTAVQPPRAPIALGAVALVMLGALGFVALRDALLGAPLPQVSVQHPKPLGPTGQYLFYPSSGHIKAGVRYRVHLYTHCGLAYPTGPDFDGSFWDTIEAVDDGSGNPPIGFGNPYDDGTIMLVSANLADYRSSGGVVVRFTRHSGGWVAGLCS